MPSWRCGSCDGTDRPSRGGSWPPARTSSSWALEGVGSVCRGRRSRRWSSGDLVAARGASGRLVLGRDVVLQGARLDPPQLASADLDPAQLAGLEQVPHDTDVDLERLGDVVGGQEVVLGGHAAIVTRTGNGEAQITTGLWTSGGRRAVRALCMTHACHGG